MSDHFKIENDTEASNVIIKLCQTSQTSVVFYWYKIHHICFYSIGLLSNISNVIFITLMYQVLFRMMTHCTDEFLLLFFAPLCFTFICSIQLCSKWRYVRSFQKDNDTVVSNVSIKLCQTSQNSVGFIDIKSIIFVFIQLGLYLLSQMLFS